MADSLSYWQNGIPVIAKEPNADGSLSYWQNGVPVITTQISVKYLYLKDGMITQEVVAGKKLSLNNNELYASASPAKPLILDNGYIKEYSA